MDAASIKAAVPLSAVLAALGIDARRERGRIPCPIHGGQNSTSFSYTRDRFHCFSCGVSGDTIALVQVMRGNSFPSARRFVAEVGGISSADASFDRREMELVATRRRRRATLVDSRKVQRTHHAVKLHHLDRQRASIGRDLAAAISKRDAARVQQLWHALFDIATEEVRTLADDDFLERATIDELAVDWLRAHPGCAVLP